jgi:hypothetical protein
LFCWAAPKNYVERVCRILIFRLTKTVFESTGVRSGRQEVPRRPLPVLFPQNRCRGQCFDQKFPLADARDETGFPLRRLYFLCRKYFVLELRKFPKKKSRGKIVHHNKFRIFVLKKLILCSINF